MDAAQGIEAQTLANLYLAMEHDLQIIPVLNKIDLPAAQPEKFAKELANLVGCEPEDVLKVSAKTGEGVAELLDKVVRDVPAPVGVKDAPARAMIFDSVYDAYRGVVTYVKVVDGTLSKRERIRMMSTGAAHELLEIGTNSPEMTAADGLSVGEVGYLITGVKDVRQSKVGDTITQLSKGADVPLGGYKDRSRWSSPVCTRSTAPTTRSCATRWTSSSSTTPRWSTSRRPPRPSASLPRRLPGPAAPGGHPRAPGARVRPRPDRHRPQRGLPRGHGGRRRARGHQPSEFPTGKIDKVHEPVVRATILAPSEFIGAIMELCQNRRGNLLGMDYLSEDRVEIRYTLPLAEVVFDFFDQLKSRPAATPRWTTSPPASRPPTWSRSTSCCTATRSTRSPRSATRTRRTRTAYGCRQAARADPAAELRGADPGRHRQPGHRP